LPETPKYRFEFKYQLNPFQYHALRRKFKHLLAADRHAGPEGEYHIRSLYFDNIDNKALHEKLGGFLDREKIRIRIYNCSDRVIHLEKKLKHNDFSAKVREPLTRAMTDALLAGDPDVLNVPGKRLFLDVYRRMKTELLRPKVIVDYVREAYTYSFGNVRITFDKQLRTGLNNTNLFQPDLRAPRCPLCSPPPSGAARAGRRAKAWRAGRAQARSGGKAQSGRSGRAMRCRFRKAMRGNSRRAMRDRFRKVMRGNCRRAMPDSSRRLPMGAADSRFPDRAASRGTSRAAIPGIFRGRKPLLPARTGPANFMRR
jgi:hypothetical protein